MRPGITVIGWPFWPNTAERAEGSFFHIVKGAVVPWRQRTLKRLPVVVPPGPLSDRI